jgi:antitoxin component YwqK of YwqJK toxin-antitoxin module
MEFSKERLEEILKNYTKGNLIQNERDERDLRTLSQMYFEDIAHMGFAIENGKLRGTAKLYDYGIGFIKRQIYYKRLEQNKFLQFFHNIMMPFRLSYRVII